MELALFATQDVDQFDRLASMLEARSDSVTLDTGDGEHVPLPDEVVQILRQATQLLARGKAVVVTPQSRARFA